MSAADGSRPDRPAGEPLDAVVIYYRVQETLRPLMTLCSTAHYIWNPIIRTPAHSQENACRDIARISKASFDKLVEYELSGKDCAVSDAHELLWSAQSTCAALNAMALWVAHNSELNVEARFLIENRHIIESIEIISRAAFLRVADDHPQEWEADSRSKEGSGRT